MSRRRPPSGSLRHYAGGDSPRSHGRILPDPAPCPWHDRKRPLVVVLARTGARAIASLLPRRQP